MNFEEKEGSAMLSAEGISYGTRDREILYEISLRAEAGEFVVSSGPMGAESPLC